MIRLTYKLSPEDGGDFLRDSRMPRGDRTIGIMGSIVALFVLGGGLYAASDGRFLNGVVVAAIGIPFATYAARSFGYFAPKTVEIPSQIADERSVEIFSDGMNFDSSATRQAKLWGDFSSYLETEKLILLYQKDMFVRMIPKRVVLPGQLSEIQEILKAKLPARRGPSKSRLMF